MAWITVTGIILLILIAAAAVEIYREIHYFEVTHYELRQKKLKGLARDINIVFLSDLHNRVYGVRNDVLIRAIKREKPDLILIGGDMLVGKEKAGYDAALDFVRQLPEICPVIYANGNHEQRMKEEPENYQASYSEYRETLKKCGVLFLENESCRVEAGNVILKVSGLELPLRSYKKFRKERLTKEDISRLLGFMAGEGEGEQQPYHILLAHNPSYMKVYQSWGADVVLSGHLHGGIVRVPGFRGVITPQAFLFPRYSGEMTVEGEKAAVVSRGLGTHTINIRLFNMSEVVSLRLKGN